MNKAAIYCRVSSDRQREKSTIQSQKDILPKLATDNGYSVVQTYIDDGISGETIEERPAFMQLLADADEKRFDAVFVIDYDRLSRASDLAQFAYIKSVFKRNGVFVITPFQRYDFQNEEDDFVSDLLGILAKREKLKIKSRCKRGRMARWKQGKHAHALTLYGYRWNGTAYQIHEEEAAVVRLIFDLAIKDLGSDRIANELAARGIPSPSESRNIRHERKLSGWSKSTICRTIRMTSYVGDHFHGRTEVVGRKLVKKPESEWIKIPIPAIITRSQWDLANQLMQKRKSFSGGAKRQYLLSHLIRCGQCGSSLIGETKVIGKRFGYYICIRRRRARFYKAPCDLPWQSKDALEAAVWSSVVRIVDEPEFLKSELRRDFEERTKKADTGLDRSTIEKMIRIKQLERERVLTLFRRGRISSEDVDREFAKVEGEEVLLKRNLELIENREKIERTLTRSLDRIEERLSGMRSRLHSLSFEERRRLIESLTYNGKAGIIINKNNEIEFDGLIGFENSEWLAEKIETLSVG